MGKMWKNLCKNLSKSMLKKCALKSGKKFQTIKLVEKTSFSHKSSKVFNAVFNKKFHLLNSMFCTVSTGPINTTIK